MKKIYLLAVTLFAAFTVQAQDIVKFAPLDASPVDIAYFPNKAVKFKKTDTFYILRKFMIFNQP